MNKILKINFSYKTLLSIALFLTLIFSGCKRGSQDRSPFFRLGGDFTLTDHNEKKFNLKELRGKVVLLFFGYTYCPDFCPTTLTKIKTSFGLLKDQKDKVQVLFVSVDPERDTAEILKKYIESFKINGIALTGTQKEVKDIVKRYGAIYRKEDSDDKDRYIISHTTNIYILGKQGKIRVLFSGKQSAEELAKIISSYL